MLSGKYELSSGWLAPPQSRKEAILIWPVSRIQLSRAKHRSLAGHSNISKFISRLLPAYEFDENQFFNTDNVSTEIAERRRDGFLRLSCELLTRSRQSLAMSEDVKEGVSDMQFVSRYRVPFQYSSVARQYLKIPSFVSHANGIKIYDLDGNDYYDLTGSYGVNVFGHACYSDCIQTAAENTSHMVSVLGNYHPSLARNVKSLQAISGMDEVSFHMSGTEAVMQAVRLARYHTGKRRVVRFCGAYHGWWGDVQPGIGNPSRARDTYTLADMSDKALGVLASRNDIACVLVNPLQALHPNTNAPGDSSLIAQRQSKGVDKATYAAWLKRLRDVCSQAGIALIFDEVFVGFRLAKGGAQAYFGVQADMVTYGKTLGGGLPVGVLCGQHQWMRRFSPAKPADICFARGTFNSHPLVMAAMHQFLNKLESPAIDQLYAQQDAFWQNWQTRFNTAMQAIDAPVFIEHIQSIWTINYTAPSRYHWMLQFYLRAQGLALPWVGTGRLIFSLNYTQADMEVILEKFTNACINMRADGWWECGLPNAKAINKLVLKETLQTYSKAMFAVFRINPLAPQQIKG